MSHSKHELFRKKNKDVHKINRNSELDTQRHPIKSSFLDGFHQAWQICHLLLKQPTRGVDDLATRAHNGTTDGRREHGQSVVKQSINKLKFWIGV